MARKLRMLAPFDYASGNLSGAQKLQYAKNNNPSWDAPIGSNAARNYRTRYVGVYRAATGTSTFAVRTKNISNNSEKMRKFQSLFGGASVCFISASQTLVILTQLQAAYQAERERRPGLTFRKWLTDYMYYMLENKMNMMSISTPLGTVRINSPWVTGGTGVDLEGISADTIAKFWMYLADNPVQRLITGAGTAVGYAAEQLNEIVASNHNNLGITLATVQGDYAGKVAKIGINFIVADDPETEQTGFQIVEGDNLSAFTNWRLSPVVGQPYNQG